MSSLTKEDKKKLENSIGWDDSYTDPETAVIRIVDVANLTCLIFTILWKSVFDSSDIENLFTFLVKLLPTDFSSPHMKDQNSLTKYVKKVNNQRKKLNKSRTDAGIAKSTQFLAKPFFEAFDDDTSSIPSSSNRIPAVEVSSMSNNLKRKLETLENDIKNAKRECSRWQEKCFNFEKSENNLNKVIIDIKKKNSFLQEENKRLAEEIKHLQKVNAGCRSGKARKEEKILGLKSSLESSLGDTHTNCIQITQRTDCDYIFLGRQKGSGEQIFFNLGQSRKVLNSDLKNSGDLKNRAEKSILFMQLVSGVTSLFMGGSNSPVVDADKELKILMKKILKISNTLKESLKPEVPKITVQQAVDMQSHLRFTDNCMRKLRIFLGKVGHQILPSEQAIRNRRATQITHLANDSSLISETFKLKLIGKEDLVGDVDVLKATNLVEYVTAVTKQLKEQGRLIWKNEEDKVLNLYISGDKGGGYTKFHFQITNITSSSAFDVHLFCMYGEGSDCMENIYQVLKSFKPEFDKLQNGCMILEYKLDLKWGGDYAFQDSLMGHQGSSATYPSNKDLVTLDHLRHHGSDPHTPEHCNIELRTMQQYIDNYNENLAHGGDENLRQNGKHHYSVIGMPAVPIASVEYMVPAILHIKLGITLKLFELLLEKCRALDKSVAQHRGNKDLHQQFKKDSKRLQEKRELLDALGVNYVEFCNLILRFEFKLAGNKGMEIENLAKGEEGDEKIHEGIPEPCESVLCVITQYDPDPWVQCSNCKKWVHAMCDIIRNDELLRLRMNRKLKYTCIQCARQICPNTIIDYVKNRQAEISADQDKLKEDIQCLSNKIKEFMQNTEAMVGPRERALLDILSDLKVDRQAYHSHSFVGNHCSTILKNYATICSVIKDLPEHHTAFLEIFSCFADGQPLLRTKRFLSEDEIQKLERLCHKFGVLYPHHFPKEHISRKIHEYIFNVPRFVKRFQTIGMFSEEEGEAIHHIVNQEARQVTNIRNKVDKMKNIFRKVETLGNADPNLITPNRRLCQTCPRDPQNRCFLNKGKCPKLADPSNES